MGDYTLKHPLVSPNLYRINPLSAVVAFRTETEQAVTVTVKGKSREGDISHTFPRAKEHILPILGLYPGWKNQVEIREYRGESVTLEIETPDIFHGKNPVIFHGYDAGISSGQLYFPLSFGK